VDFIVNNLPIIICAILGITLLVVEIFMPGFGIPGISGIVLLAASVVFTWMQYGEVAGLGVAVIVLAVCGLAITLSLRSAAKGRLSRSPLMLKGGQSREEGFVAMDDLSGFVGQTGYTTTVLRPAGNGDFDGMRLNIVSNGEFIPKGAKVIITRVEGARILVEKVEL
jgi:membrane-bound ClpP family serine protease